MSWESIIGAIQTQAEIRPQLAAKAVNTPTSQVYLLQSEAVKAELSPTLPIQPDKHINRLKLSIISIINHSYRFNVKISIQDISVYESKSGKDATIKIFISEVDLDVAKNIANYLESRIGANYDFEIDSKVEN